MTYNFDPDRWYENEQRALETALREGSMSDEAYEKALDALEKRYDAMVARLDGTYQIDTR